jgi:signal transduction histidine kinase
VARGLTLGTVTLYTGFPYHFSYLDEGLVWCFAARFGEYWDRYRLLADQARTQAALDEMRFINHNRLVESQKHAALRAAETQSATLLHEAKGVYTSAILLLDQARSASPSMRIKLIAQCLSKLQEGEKQLYGTQLLHFSEQRSSDVTQLIRSLVQQRTEWKQERGIKIEFDLDLKDLPLLNIAEEDVIAMTENLLSNAIRSIRSAERKLGHIRIETSVLNTPYGKEMEFSIRDNGTGIRRDLLNRIFQKGFTTYSAQGGSGLGLYLVQGIVRAYRGNIKVDSQYGSFARFVIRLPIN